ncbi:hypothetical protein B0H11DRAFT_2229282 [Mycena galericulata]|nr:hypothetical protein B0H11DRAFT_2229282 [Mycena galericulata]
MAEEDIDNETLQAQIDLSLSFAQNLVSSWVKPASKPTKNSSRVLEAELKEYMRRPPRLGVGAPIPEAASSSRETERLKSHLSGKGSKRARGDDDEAVAKQLSDNEEESRGASVKKKARIDPFEAHRKKKKKEINGNSTPGVTLPPPDQDPLAKESVKVVSEDNLASAESLSPPISPSKRRKKKKHKNRDHLESTVDPESIPRLSNAPSDNANDSTTALSISEVCESPASKVIDISLVSSTPVSPTSPSRRVQSDLLKGPILNLTGPPTDDESGEEGEPGNPPASPKKKRRKRKKKKSSMGAPHSQTV